MKYILLLSIAIGSVTSAAISAAQLYGSFVTAPEISGCPPLAPRQAATDVHNLRADDIKVIAAMGDSVTAGLLAKNVNTSFLTFEQFKEYRGSSWIMGGDSDTHSLANYFKHFSPELYGPSVGSKPARLCPSKLKARSLDVRYESELMLVFLETFFCFDTHHDPEIDMLNAAQSGATAVQLPEQVDYIVDRIGSNTPYENEWKLINLFIGFNDASVSCLSPNSTELYKTNVRIALEKLIDKVDYAFINLVGIMKYNELVYLTDKAPGYKKQFRDRRIDLLNYECYCCRQPNAGIDFIGTKVKEFNHALEEISREINLKGKKQVAVVYQLMNPDISTVYPSSLSNLDGYHPNVVGYTYMSKALWNQMHRTKSEKIQFDQFDPNIQIICPTNSNTLKTT